MFHYYGEGFTFVETQKPEAYRIEQGWELKKPYPFVLDASVYQEQEKVIHLLRESDVVILGSVPDELLKDRIHYHRDGITLRYSERIYKKGTWRCLSPRGIIKSIINYHVLYHKNLYMLCASAYVSADLSLHGTYHGRCYKWGYFPPLFTYDIEELMEKKKHGTVQLLWCGRFIRWKHPDTVIRLAYRLSQDDISFHLNMIGSGEEEQNIKQLIRNFGLETNVTLHGVKTTEEVRSFMEEADIFLMTSDYEEGWGAVLNEAMNSGCAVIASHAAGAAPYLIENGINGILYPNQNMDRLYLKTKLLIIDQQFRNEIGIHAYKTITEIWNAKAAVKRLITFLEDISQNGECNRYKEGPLSKATIMFNHWYRER